jgi:hypothetical protein
MHRGVHVAIDPSSTDLIMLVMSAQGADKRLESKFT